MHPCYHGFIRLFHVSTAAGAGGAGSLLPARARVRIVRQDSLGSISGFPLPAFARTSLARMSAPESATDQRGESPLQSYATPNRSQPATASPRGEERESSSSSGGAAVGDFDVILSWLPSRKPPLLRQLRRPHFSRCPCGHKPSRSLLAGGNGAGGKGGTTGAGSRRRHSIRFFCGLPSPRLIQRKHEARRRTIQIPRSRPRTTGSP